MSATSRVTLVFVTPQLLESMIDGGRARLRAGYIGSDRDHELEDAENREGGFGDHEAEAESHDVQAFGDYDAELTERFGYFGDYDGITEGDADDDDSHEDLLHRIKRLKYAGKR